jgi:hypothetical protein
VWDSQHWTFVSLRFRKLTFGVWEGLKRAGGHQYTLFDGFGYQPNRRSSKMRLARVQVRRSKVVERSYDTFEDVVPCTRWAEGRRGRVITGELIAGG